MKENVRIFLMSGLLEEYAMGLTSPEQNREIESYIQEYPEVAKAYEEVQNEMERYAMSVQENLPSGFKEKVMEPIGTGTASGRRILIGPIGWVATLLLLGMSIWSLERNAEVQDLKRSKTEMVSEFNALKESCEQLETQRARMAFIETPSTHAWDLVSLDKQSPMALTAFWNPQIKQGHLMIKSLPAPPDGHCYQIWADVEGEMISVGVLPKKGDWLELSFLEHIESLNLTIEEDGGAEHPNVKMLVANVNVPVTI